VAQKIKSSSMKRIGAGLCDSVDYTAGSEPVLGGIVAGQHRKLVNRVDAQVGAENASGTGVGIIVHDRAVKTITVLRGPASTHAQLFPKPAPASSADVRDVQMSSSLDDSRLQRCQRRPVASIQGQFSNLVASDVTGDRRIGRLDERSRAKDFDCLLNL